MTERKKILLVEDEALIALNEIRVLEGHGFEALHVCDAEGAVDTMKDSPVDLILMDIDLGPGRIDGTRAAEAILRDYEVPIVFLTSHAEKEIVEKVKGITRYGYVLKDSGEFVLIETINMALELFEVNRRFKSFMNHIPGAAFLKDEEDRLVYCNDLYAAMLDTVPDRIIGTNTNDRLPAELREKYQRENHSIISEKKIITAESVYPKSDELSYWLTYKFPIDIGSEVFIGAISLDITERKKILQALRDSEEQLRKVFETENVAIAISRKSDGVYLHANPGFLKLTGYTAEEIIGSSSRELGFMSTERRRALAAGIEEKGTLEQEELTFPTRSGQYKTILFSISGLKIKEEECFLATMIDITQRKRSEQLIKDSLEEKEFLLGELNHRIKNNLLIISSLIGLKDTTLGDRGDLSDLRNQVEAIRIVHDKLYQTGNASNINLSEYIGDLISTLFRNYSERSIEYEVAAPKLLLPAKTCISLGLIVNELATNAIKYGFTDTVQPWFSVKVSLEGEGADCVVTVANSGNPFPSHIELDNPDTLGLRLILSLTTQLEGSLELIRDPSPEFTLRFPLD